MGGAEPPHYGGVEAAYTMPEKSHAPQHPVTLDAPLPGFYPCLTLQLNVTRYASGGLGRMVLVVREPSDGVEVHRVFFDTQDWEPAANAARAALADCLGLMRYLQEGNITT